MDVIGHELLQCLCTTISLRTFGATGVLMKFSLRCHKILLLLYLLNVWHYQVAYNL